MTTEQLKTAICASQENLDQFREQGFTVLRGFLSPDEVAAARSVCDANLLDDEVAETEIPAGVLLQLPEFAGMLFSERMTTALESVMGEGIGFYPNFVVRLNRYTIWHIDNGFMSCFHGNPDHLLSPSFRHAQCVIYLQDNDAKVGGGLDVRPGSHRYFDDGKVCNPIQLLEDYPAEVTIDSRAGDLVLIDGRIMHRGTPAQEEPKIRKYGLFFSASAQNEVQATRFLEYLSRRSAYLRETWKLDDTPEMGYMLKRYDDVLDMRFPSSFRPADVDFMRRSNLKMYCLNDDDLANPAQVAAAAI